MDRTVSFWTEGMEPRQARLINLSRSGMYIETTHHWIQAVNKDHAARFDGQEFSQRDRPVVRRAAHGMAIQLQ